MPVSAQACLLLERTNGFACTFPDETIDAACFIPEAAENPLNFHNVVP
jgi:hypothetical protein